MIEEYKIANASLIAEKKEELDHDIDQQIYYLESWERDLSEAIRDNVDQDRVSSILAIGFVVVGLFLSVLSLLVFLA